MSEKLSTAIVDTPIGAMRAVASERGLCALEFLRPDRQKLWNKRLKRWFKEPELTTQKNEHIDNTKKWVKYYFAGDIAQLPKIKLDLRGTDFETKVWKALLKIKLGEKMSYSQLAKRLAIPGAQRAVGNANRRNPIPLIVPCHRVIGANGKVIGYASGINHKVWLITHESKARSAS